MLLGIGIGVLLIGTVAYVAWLVWQAVYTGPRLRRLEKEACRRAWQEDREDELRRSDRPVLNRRTPPTQLPKSSDRPRSSAGSNSAT